jgi:hypothetical protein
MTGTSEGARKAWSKRGNKKRRRILKEKRKSDWKKPSYRAKFCKYPRKQYPHEVELFIGMHDRVKGGYSTTTWARSREGFFDFLSYVGKIPTNMKKATLGRKDHSKGYEPGNCFWQSQSDNTKEMNDRRFHELRLNNRAF